MIHTSAGWLLKWNMMIRMDLSRKMLSHLMTKVVAIKLSTRRNRIPGHLPMKLLQKALGWIRNRFLHQRHMHRSIQTQEASLKPTLESFLHLNPRNTHQMQK